MRLKTPEAPTPSLPTRSRYRTLILGAAGVLLSAAAIWYAACWVVWSSHFRAAAIPIRTRDYPTAEQHLSWCRWAWPSDPETWLLSSRIARRAGERKQSQDWLDR